MNAKEGYQGLFEPGAGAIKVCWSHANYSASTLALHHDKSQHAVHAASLVCQREHDKQVLLRNSLDTILSAFSLSKQLPYLPTTDYPVRQNTLTAAISHSKKCSCRAQSVLPCYD